jgi:hypothetical protein
MVITILNYLDFGSIFVNELIGDLTLAFIILMIILVSAMIKMGFNEKIIFIMVGVSGFVWIMFSADLFVKIIILGIIVILLAVNGLKALRGG